MLLLSLFVETVNMLGTNPISYKPCAQNDFMRVDTLLLAAQQKHDVAALLVLGQPLHGVQQMRNARHAFVAGRSRDRDT